MDHFGVFPLFAGAEATSVMGHTLPRFGSLRRKHSALELRIPVLLDRFRFLREKEKLERPRNCLTAAIRLQFQRTELTA